MSEMSFEEAAAALDAAVAEDSGVAPQTPAAPVEQAPEPSPVPTPEGQTAPEQPAPEFNRDELGRFARFEQETPAVDSTPDLFEGAQVNPDTLIAEHPELAPLVKQLQGVFTQKTQALAEERKQFEGIDVAEARQAVELYNALQDPNYLVQFHGELSQALQAQGLTPAQADAQAAQELGTTPQAVGQAGDALAALRSDPELAPVADMVGGLQSQLQQMQSQLAQAEAYRQQQELELVLAGEQLRQEALLRESGMTDKHIGVVRKLAPVFDGSLTEAAELLKDIRQGTLEEYLGSKTTLEAGVGPVQGQGVSEVPSVPEDLDEALAAAQETLAAQGITDLL